ncbi:hypothetical protein [Desulfatibacillum aliphaticivorans]|uniref:hypothetical protein n=1 Tax=Desulfatibacillum aliphaticivorans TaxID=218208 RepID=UPI0004818ED4|nr:hypothetical protein [Desulfatibacillum aliphaticivorans]
MSKSKNAHCHKGSIKRNPMPSKGEQVVEQIAQSSFPIVEILGFGKSYPTIWKKRKRSAETAIINAIDKSRKNGEHTPLFLEHRHKRKRRRGPKCTVWRKTDA